MPASVTQNPAALGSSAHYVSYTGTPVDTDLVAEGFGAACRRIRALAAGTMKVKRASDNEEVVLNFLAGETQEVSANALVATGSTVNGFTIYW